MPRNSDSQQFRNEELLLKVSPAVDRSRWDESRYEAFIDELCGTREYQKEAIRITLRYLLAGEYADLRALAKANYDDNHTMEARYGSWSGMERHLQMPDKLSASLDLATGTGKSYVLYGIAGSLLVEGLWIGFWCFVHPPLLKTASSGNFAIWPPVQSCVTSCHQRAE